MMNIFQKALKCGYSVIPCNGKKPSVSWKQYQKIPATIEQAKNWTGNIAIVCGKVSGGLVVLDFDIKNGNRFDDWIRDVNAIDSKVLSKLYIETTPSGGYHVCYKSKSGVPNMKLACNKENLAMIETKGEGGCSNCAPSEGYHTYYNTLKNINVISDEEESVLLAVAESFNELERKEYIPKNKTEITGDTILNRYDSIANPVQLLQKHGWKVVFSRGEKVYLERPDKKDGSISATWNVIPDRFYCFSTSTIFESEHVYKASAIYAILEHGGDFAAACKCLAGEEKMNGGKIKNLN